MLREFLRGSPVVAAVFVAALTSASARAGIVTDCGDAKDATGTLRAVVGSAVNNDVIDVSQCSTITLLYDATQDAISTALSLTILGPLDGLTTIDAGTNGRAFVDTGASSTLVLEHLLIEHGRAPGADPRGGCVLASYQVSLDNTTLFDCAATSNDGIAQGGAVNAPVVSLASSVVSDSLASSANADAEGGGVYAATQITCLDSTIRNNSVLSGGLEAGPSGRGGGVRSNYPSFTRCALIGNHASHNAGAVFANNLAMLDSTVSGNSADYFVGGIAAGSFATISNSTIAFNSGNTCGGLYGPSGSIINSSIIANNTATSASACHDVNAGFGTGTNNLVGVADVGVTLPGDTYVGDPQLTPLGDHGGPTPTHALLATSYAVDHGNNVNMLDTDQRGLAREVGGAADIGAYERQVADDEIFYSGLQ